MQGDPHRFDVILLDWMMPHMDGMEVLERIKSKEALRTIPVIFQTARSAHEDIQRGLEAGVHYYVTKPFNNQNLLAIVASAVEDYGQIKTLRQKLNDLSRSIGTLSHIMSGRFRFSRLVEAQNLATLLAHACPNAKQVTLGLAELLINAVEHGNLEIGYQEKTRLRQASRWEEEIHRRQEDPRYRDRFVEVTLTHEVARGEVQFLIQDQGAGFDWNDFLDFSPKRVFDTHGRGIAMARALSFDRIEYQGCGNRVLAVVKISA